MKYKIFDTQLKDYLQPYNDKDYWTLEEAAGLAYRRWEQAGDEEEGEQAEYCYSQQSKMVSGYNETQVAMALQVFDYALERVEE